MMKKPLSLLLSLFFALTPAAPCMAQAARKVVRLQKTVAGVETLTRAAFVAKISVQTPLMLPMRFLPAQPAAFNAAEKTLPAKVARGVAGANAKEVNLTTRTLTQNEVFEILRNFRTAPERQQPKLYTNVFAYLNISRNFAVRKADLFTAQNQYRNIAPLFKRAGC